MVSRRGWPILMSGKPLLYGDRKDDLRECSIENRAKGFDMIIQKHLSLKSKSVHTASVDSIIRQAVEKLNTNNNAEALLLLEQAVIVNPDIPNLNYGKAVALARLGQTDEAIESLNSLLSLSPNHQKAKELLNQLLTDLVYGMRTQAANALNANQDSEAFMLVNKAKALKRPIQGLDHLRAICFLKMNQYDPAREALREELRHFPDNLEAEKFLNQMLAHYPQNKICKVSTSICWINERDREIIRNELSTENQFEDIREVVKLLELDGFNPGEPPITKKDKILYDHWSCRAIKRIEELSRDRFVITTVGDSARMKGAFNQNIKTITQEDWENLSLKVLEPIITSFLESLEHIEGVASPEVKENLIFIGSSSNLIAHYLSGGLQSKLLKEGKFDNKNCIMRAISDMQTSVQMLKEINTIRNEFGKILLILSQMVVRVAENDGVLQELINNDVIVKQISTKYITKELIKTIIADYLRFFYTKTAFVESGHAGLLRS